MERIAERLNRPGAQLAVLMAFGLAYRISTFGHPNLHIDEAFYFLVGQEMHHGAVPYVDLWDRKPFGLFALYWLFAGLSDSVLAYQIPAWLFASATAWVIARIVAEMADPRGGLLAGLIYLTSLPLFLGGGGQSPVFYNLPIAGAALLVLRAWPALRAGTADRRVDSAMLLCGLAITIKQTALFESVFLGLACVVALLRSGCRTGPLAAAAARWLVLGAAPAMLIALAYWLSGHWSEFWHAMVTSNLEKRQSEAAIILRRALWQYWRISPLLAFALVGLVLRSEGTNAGRHRAFLVAWLIAALIGVAIIPNAFSHYMLPLLVPLSVAAGLIFARRDLGLVMFCALLAINVWRFDFLDRGPTIKARQTLDAMAETIRRHGGERGLLIFEGPLLLYPMTGNRPPSPLAFSMHLSAAVEKDVSHLDANREVSRILSRHPGVLLVSRRPRHKPPNLATIALVTRYVASNCKLVDSRWSAEWHRQHMIDTYGDCSPGRR